MTNTLYTTLDTVLYDISLLLDEQQYNEAKLREWALKGLRKLKSPSLYTTEVCVLNIEHHKALLPANLKYIIQAAYLPKVNKETLISELQHSMNLDNPADNLALSYIEDKKSLPMQAIKTLSHRWQAMRMSSSSMIKAITLEGGPYSGLYNCPDCGHEFIVDSNNCITTTAKDGFVMLSYLAYATSTDNTILIPDDEDLKEAIQHFCLFNYWMSKTMHKEEGSIRERDWHLLRFQTLATKVAGKQVGLHNLENLKNASLRLHQQTNQFDNFFEDLNKPTNL